MTVRSEPLLQAVRCLEALKALGEVTSRPLPHPYVDLDAVDTVRRELVDMVNMALVAAVRPPEPVPTPDERVVSLEAQVAALEETERALLDERHQMQARHENLQRANTALLDELARLKGV